MSINLPGVVLSGLMGAWYGHRRYADPSSGGISGVVSGLARDIITKIGDAHIGTTPLGRAVVTFSSMMGSSAAFHAMMGVMGHPTNVIRELQTVAPWFAAAAILIGLVDGVLGNNAAE